MITWTNYLISDIYRSFCETKSWKKTHQGFETDLYLFEFGIGAGTWCFCSVGFAEGLHSNNSLFLRVCSKVFNLSLPFSFLSLSIWLCYYRIQQESFEHIWSTNFFFNNFINKIKWNKIITKWFFQLLIRRLYLSLLNEMNMTLLNPTQPIKRVIHFTKTHVIFLLEPKFGTKPFP